MEKLGLKECIFIQWLSLTGLDSFLTRKRPFVISGWTAFSSLKMSGTWTITGVFDVCKNLEKNRPLVFLEKLCHGKPASTIFDDLLSSPQKLLSYLVSHMM
ncbi:uncharacterized protein LOC114732991 [Neltuma alba]|uniref:uncharacterized protein LOC114716153 n=1 Tax=Neltuma alba TaxID=207710 RepID=UPI0010A53F6B|nr:uncharacterized protein LOC114716153 [Prosopis alba]XP_028776243.1 uncharacterized protein LOC114732991 [Prosopis alba]